MTESRVTRLAVHGTLVGSLPPAQQSSDTTFSAIIDATPRDGSAFELDPVRSDQSTSYTIDCTDDDVIELRLEGGLQVYTSVARLSAALAQQTPARGDGGAVVIPQRLKLYDERSRGNETLSIERIQLLDIKGSIVDLAADKSSRLAALKLAQLLENQLVGTGGLFRIDQLDIPEQDNSALPVPVSPQEIDNSRPVLIFIHGTASSSKGSFGELWRNREDPLWQSIQATYGDNIYAFEHRTLSESPIRNALQLIASLPVDQRVHLVSHSRGGLVGELLCRGQFSNGRAPFVPDDLSLFEEEDNDHLRALFAKGVSRDSYREHREDLKNLNEALIKSRLKIERFVRVACPARGTTLASGKLDLYLSTLFNLAGLIPVLRTSVIYSFLKAFTLATAKQRTEPEVLPGLEAMMPGSPLICLLNGTHATTTSHLAVIAGDIEATGIFRKLALALVDRFYSSDHDLIVNTPSMDGGARRLNQVPTMRRQGSEVNHFSYFENRVSRQGVLDALTLNDLPPGFSYPEQPPLITQRSQPQGRKPDQAPSVFLLPGISGSHLQRNDNRIWLDIPDLVLGRFGQLKIDADDVAPDAVIGAYYGNLANYLSHSHEVIPFPYDWRQSILEASTRLAAAIEKRLTSSPLPVRIIAHSMGGLVVRGMMAQHPQLWHRLRQRAGSRVLMLGTPNGGSHSILRLLADQDKLIKYLAVIDLRHNAYDLINILSRFPGVLELLPTHDEVVHRPELWSSFEQILGKDGGTRWKKPLQKDLKKARQTWDILATAEMNPEHVFYLAGHATATPTAVETSTGKIRFESTTQGDGQVPWETGIPKGIKHWFVDAEHGDLADHKPAFDAILQIIERGDTQLLPRVAPASRGSIPALEIPPATVDFLPDETDLAAAALGASTNRDKHADDTLPTITLSVCHGNIRFSRFPVMVSHYQDDTIVSAEAELDRQLGGRLKELYRLGVYPGPLRTSEVFLDCQSGFPGVVIVGLGEVGELTPGALTDTYREALLRFALRFRDTNEGTSKAIKVSSLLIGTGAGGLPLDDAVAAMLQGAAEANTLLAGDTLSVGQTIGQIEFVELYEDIAVQTHYVLQQLTSNATLQPLFHLQDSVTDGEGGHRRISYGDDQGWWQRLRIEGNAEDGLKFTSLTRRARIPSSTNAAQLASITPFLEAATRDTSTDARVGRVLFELLVPHDFKNYARHKNDLVLMLDDFSAIFPWELVRYGGRSGDEAVALQAGLIRQLVTTSNERPNLCHNRRALVIGDPQSDFPALPGAQAEAQEVERVLKTAFADVEVQLRPQGSEVLTALLSAEYQILHLAGHGAYEYQWAHGQLPLTGMIIGKQQFLTAAELRQMPATPEFVFINCCHLGKIGERDVPARGNFNRLAANLATQLIRQGVRAVIAAGWEVDDAAAQTFASAFYRQLLAGDTFGDAVFAARIETYDQHPAVDTWGAYQCYGDHGYQVTSAQQNKPGHARKSYVTRSEAINDINNCYQDARSATVEGANYLTGKLIELEQRLPRGWQEHGDLLSALAQAWSELDNFPRAIALYNRALAANDGQGQIAAIEQRAHCLANEVTEAARVTAVRHVVNSRVDSTKQPRQPDFAAHLKKLQASQNELQSLNKNYGETVQRWSLLGLIAASQALLYALNPDGSSRTKSEITKLLDAMEMSYEQALALAGENQADITKLNELMLKSLTAHWLGTQLDKRRKLRSDLYNILSTAMDQSDAFEPSREHVTEEVTRAGWMVLRALAESKLPAEGEAILRQFKRLRRLTTSPRQLRGARKDMQFIADIIHFTGDTNNSDLLDELQIKLAD